MDKFNWEDQFEEIEGNSDQVPAEPPRQYAEPAYSDEPEADYYDQGDAPQSDDLQEISPEEEAEFLSNANTRLEQAQLYRVLINHSIFDGVEADSKVISRVEREVKLFARERLEVLLGMREDARARHSQSFTDLEVDLLKRMVEKFSGGVNKQFVAPPKAAPVAAKSPTLRPITSVAKAPEAPRRAQEPAKPVAPRPRPQPSAPAQRPAPQPSGQPQPASRRKITGAQMRERNKEASQRQAERKAAIPADRPPAPSGGQAMLMHYANSRANMNDNVMGSVLGQALVNKFTK